MCNRTREKAGEWKKNPIALQIQRVLCVKYVECIEQFPANICHVRWNLKSRAIIAAPFRKCSNAIIILQLEQKPYLLNDSIS